MAAAALLARASCAQPVAYIRFSHTSFRNEVSVSTASLHANKHANKHADKRLSTADVISTLARSIRAYRAASIATPVCVLLEVACECFIPFFTAQLIADIQRGAALMHVVQSGLRLCGVSLVALLVGCMAGYFCSKASAGLAKNLRHDIFNAVQHFSFAQIGAYSQSGLVTRLTTDVTNVQISYMLLIRLAVRAPILFFFALVSATIMAGAFSVVYIFAATFLACALMGIIRVAGRIFRRVFPQYDELTQSVEETVSGIRVVKSYTREPYEYQRFSQKAQALYSEFIGAQRIVALNNPAMNFAIYGMFAAMVYFGSYVIITSQSTLLNVGQLSALITYGFQILMSLMMLSFVFVQTSLSEESAQRICEVLREQSEITNPAHPLYTVPSGSIDFENVSFKYTKDARHRALKNVTLHIAAGETIGVLGMTGSAKSTLVELIARLYDVTEGCIRVGGNDVRAYDIATLRQAIGFVLQKNMLVSGTIAENLRWGNLNATREDMRAACAMAAADEFIHQLNDGYDTHVEQGGSNFSGGQKQRLCIARALLKQPKILILDDSTSAVDTKTDAHIRTALAAAYPTTTKIIISQRVSSIQDANRIVVMDRGCISAVGSHEELLRTSAIYKETYCSQTRVEDGGEA